MSSLPLQESSQLAHYLTARVWHKTHPNPFFPTYDSFEWFIRMNRAELVESGQLILRRGSAGSLIGPGFDAKVLEIMRRKSAQQAGIATPAAA